MSLLQQVLVNQRWIFVCLFLLPASLVCNIFFYIRNLLIFRLRTAPKLHGYRVQQIQRQVKQWNLSGRHVQMCTGRPGWQAMSFRQGIYKSTMHNVDINLMDILEVDTDRRIVRLEPLVSMGQLSKTLNALGWTLPIVPELDDLTVGGLIMGSGVESSSHKYGLFQEICVSYELVMGDGSLVKCSKDENEDLYFSVPWSHGTLGFLVSAELRIIPIKKYVKITYQPCLTVREIVEVMAKSLGSAEFVDGIAYSSNTAVIMTADMTDTVERDKLNEIGKYNKPWFYTHVETFLSKGPAVEYIPIRDYYHRYSRGIFWELKYIIPFGNNFIFRNLFGWLTPPNTSLLKLTQTQEIKELYENNHFIQDMIVPFKDMMKTIQFLDQKLKVYPVWLCPVILSNTPGMVHSRGQESEMFVDIGLYGAPGVESFDPKETTRSIEAFVRKRGGFQMLYADSYLTLEEFREMFDHSLYYEMRNKLRCQKAFPEVYDKVKKSARK